MRKACSALTERGAASLNTDIISRKSSNVQSPSLLELNTLQIWSPNGFTLSSGYCSTFAIESFAFLLCPTFSGASALNFLCALHTRKESKKTACLIDDFRIFQIFQISEEFKANWSVMHKNCINHSCGMQTYSKISFFVKKVRSS